MAHFRGVFKASVEPVDVCLGAGKGQMSKSCDGIDGYYRREMLDSTGPVPAG
jgi:hypothetical protein